MRIPSTYSVPPPGRDGAPRPRLVPLGQTPPAEVAAQHPPRTATPGASSVEATRAPAQAARRAFSVLNDFRYLTDSDKELLGAVTGDKVDAGITDRPGAASAFAQQLALDRRTGSLAPGQDVTGVYLRNAAAELDKANEGRRGYTNPYSGAVMTKALDWLDAHGRSRADIRL